MKPDDRQAARAAGGVASRVDRGGGRPHLKPVGDDGRPPTWSATDAVLALPHRFEPHHARDVRGSWVLRVGDHDAHTVHVDRGTCLVTFGHDPHADAALTMTEDTWLEVLEGRRSGISAFLTGDLQVRGDLNLAMRLATMFRTGPGGGRHLDFRRTLIHGTEVESIVAGEGSPVVLLHGLAANKTSFAPTLDALSAHHEVHAIDLPGFGKSDKPLPRGSTYSMGWMADIVRGYLVRNGLHDSVLVGNSMGGRIAIETALRHPHAVDGIALLGPAVAFDEWQRLGPWLGRTGFHWGALLTMSVPRTWIERAIREILFHDADLLPAGNIAAAVDDVVVSLRDRRYRMATAACARHLIREKAYGRRGFWDRLAGLSVPSLWLWGGSDTLVSATYADRVRDTVRDATVEVWDGVGHVPQFEAPDRTHASLEGFIGMLEHRRGGW